MDTETSLVKVLRATREVRGQNQAAFAKKIFPDMNDVTRRVFYNQIENGVRPYPKKHLGAAAKLLGKTLEEVTQFALNDIKLRRLRKLFGAQMEAVNEMRLSASELDILGKMSAAAGIDFSMETIVCIVSDLRRS